MGSIIMASVKSSHAEMEFQPKRASTTGRVKNRPPPEQVRSRDKRS